MTAKIPHKSAAVDGGWVCCPFFSLSVNFRGCFSQTTTVHHEAREPVAFILTAMVPDIVSMAEWRRNLLRQQREADRVEGKGAQREAEKKKIDRHGLGTEWRRQATSPSIRQRLQKPPFVNALALEKYTTTWKPRHSPCPPEVCKERWVTIYNWTRRGQFKHSHAGTDIAGVIVESSG